MAATHDAHLAAFPLNRAGLPARQAMTGKGIPDTVIFMKANAV